MTVLDGVSESGVFSVPVRYPKRASSRMWAPRPNSWEAPTLATASPGRTPARCRKRVFSATPPTAAGATIFTNDPATCASTVFPKGTRSGTKPSRLIAAAT